MSATPLASLSRPALVWSILATFLGCTPAQAAQGGSTSNPVHVEFDEIRAIPKHFPAVGDPWSPAHARLVVEGPDGYSVFDAEHPDSGLRPVYSGGWVRWTCWSPDGDWLLFVIGDASPTDSRSLVKVRWTGGPADTLAKDVPRLWPAVWCRDGAIAYLVGSEIHWIPMRAESSSSAVVPAAESTLVSGGRGGMNGLALQWVGSGMNSAQPLATPLRGYHLLLRDALPTIGRYLVQGIAEDNPSIVILDRSGRIASDLGAAALPFDPTSLSGDGTLVVGHKESDDGHTILSSDLYLSAWDGSWSAPISNAAGGMDPRFAREGRILEFVDFNDGVIHVGVLRVSR